MSYKTNNGKLSTELYYIAPFISYFGYRNPYYISISNDIYKYNATLDDFYFLWLDEHNQIKISTANDIGTSGANYPTDTEYTAIIGWNYLDDTLKNKLIGNGGIAIGADDCKNFSSFIEKHKDTIVFSPNPSI